MAYSIPAVAMGPVFILWFGIGMTPKIVIAAYFVFFIVFINTVAGFQQVPTGLLDVTRVMGASRRAQLRTVLLPSALPYVLAALRITLPAAMIGAVTGEFISSNRGLGYLTRAAASSYSTAGVHRRRALAERDRALHEPAAAPAAARAALAAGRRRAAGGRRPLIPERQE